MNEPPNFGSVSGAKNVPPAQGVSGPLPPWAIEEVPLSEKEIQRGLRLLLELVARKERLYVKPRDLIRVLGYGPEDFEVRLIGKILSELSKRGLAMKWNSSRPKRYTLVPGWLWSKFMAVEMGTGFRFRCRTGDGACSLTGTCPYWVLRGRWS